MNLDELKNTWKEYDQRLVTQGLLHDKLLKNMMKERSRTVLDKMRRKYALTSLGLILFTAFCVLSIIYNAFDYTRVLQYFPLFLYILASLLLLGFLFKGFKITRLEIEREHLLGSIKKVQDLHKKFLIRTRQAKLLFILSGLLFPLSFFSRIYEKKGIYDAWGFFFFNLLIVGVMIYLFRKMGMFRDRFGEKLGKMAEELEEYEHSAGGSFN